MGWRRDARRAMRKQRQQAKMSKRQAKRLGRIYKDMSPEEIAEMNQIAPEIATGAAQIGPQEDGTTGVDTKNDPVATMAAYNSTYGEGSGDGSNYSMSADDQQTFDDVENIDNAECAEEMDGGDLDPYMNVAGGIMGIVDQFKRNFEANKPENFDRENLEQTAQDHLFGMGNFFRKLSGRDKKEKKNIDWCTEHGFIRTKLDDSMENAEGHSTHKGKGTHHGGAASGARSTHHGGSDDSPSETHGAIAGLLIGAAITYLGYYVYEHHHKLLGGLIFGVGVFKVVKQIPHLHRDGS